MSKIKAKFLSEENTNNFSDWWISNGHKWYKNQNGEQEFDPQEIEEWITDTNNSEISPEFYIDRNKKFGKKRNFAKYIDDVFNEYQIPLQIKLSDGLWNWLTLVYYPEIRTHSGNQKTGPGINHLIKPYKRANSRTKWALLLKTAWWIYNKYPTLGIFGCDELGEWGDCNEQSFANVNERNFDAWWELVHLLYYDEKTDSTKTGAKRKDSLIFPSLNIISGQVNSLARKYNFSNFDGHQLLSFLAERKYWLAESCRYRELKTGICNCDRVKRKEHH